MRVLHYIDHVRREDLLSAYLTALTTVQEQLGVEVCVATRRDAIGQKLRSFRPHIVHVHTIWSCARRNGYDWLGNKAAAWWSLPTERSTPIAAATNGGGQNWR